MSVELRIVVPARVAQALKRRAEREKISMEELILLALAKILEEESKGGGG